MTPKNNTKVFTTKCLKASDPSSGTNRVTVAIENMHRFSMKDDRDSLIQTLTWTPIIKFIST